MIFLDGTRINASQEGASKFVGEIEEFVVNFILPIAIVIVSIGILVFYAIPAYKRVPTLKSEAKNKGQEVSALRAKVDQLTLLEENKELAVEDLVKMSWALEERDKVPELTEQVMLMSKDAGVVFKSLDYTNANKDEAIPMEASNVESLEQTYSTTPDPQLYREEKVNVGLEAKDFSSIINFLKVSESSVRLFKVESLKVDLAEKSEQNDKVSEASKVDLVMVSPYLNPVFSAYSRNVAPIDLKDSAYRQFMDKLDGFKNYAKEVDSNLPKI